MFRDTSNGERLMMIGLGEPIKNMVTTNNEAIVWKSIIHYNALRRLRMQLPMDAYLIIHLQAMVDKIDD